MSKTDFEQLKPALLAIADDEVMLPRLPIDTFIQEASDLYVWAKDDVKALGRVGLDKEVLASLPVRIDALQYIQSLWYSERRSQHDTSRKWEEMLNKGKELRRELKHSFRFAFRREELLLNKLREINRGRSYADLIQDLNDLAVLGQANLSKLQKVGFDAKKLNVAAKLCTEMSYALARKNSQDSNNDIKSFRDRAFTLLYVGVSEVRAAGRYAFRGQPDKIRGYRHRYLSRKESITSPDAS